MRKLNTIDLFSGAGGLSEGFLESGFYDFVAHVEWELPMVQTLRKNLVSRRGYTEKEALKSVIHFDIQKTDQLIHGNWETDSISKFGKNNDSSVIKKGIDGLLNGKKVDVIIGGPPCQAYSIAGRYRESMKTDYRNFLFESFVKIVDYYKPIFFVFENVPGILTAKPGDKLVINRIFAAFKKIGYKIRKPEDLKKSIYSAADYQVPQDRHRVIIFGVRNDYSRELENFYSNLDLLKSNLSYKTVRDAIGNLPKIYPLSSEYKIGNKHYSHQLLEHSEYTLHEARYHNKRDRDVFRKWILNNMNDLPNDEKVKFYNSITGKHSKNNKYRSLEWDKPSPTIVAHLYKDGLMFIHPDAEQERSITIREAAILQSFPVDYEFVGSSAYCFKMIGNAVPVLFAKTIAVAGKETLEERL